MFLGLDMGTSAVKAVLSDGAGVAATASAPLRLSSPRDGWSEQAPEDWWRAVVAVLRDLAQTRDLGAVEGVGLSGQMHGAVLLDDARQVIRPAILWNDSRSAPDCAVLEQRLPRIGEIGGVLPLPGFTAPKLMWLKREEPQAHARVRHVLLPKDYIGFRLHGGLVTDPSDAAGTLWLDQSRRAWSPDVAEASDTDPAWLPELRDGNAEAGRVTPEAAAATGLRAGTPVYAGGGDAATGAVSLGATEPGRGFISLGTSGQLFVAGDRYRPNPAAYVHAYAHTLPGRWFQMAAMLNGARPISWLAERFEIGPGDVVALAASADPGRVPLFLPYLTGERSPHGDPHIRAGFYGLDEATGRAEMARAVVEAIAFSFSDAAESFGDTLTEVPHLTCIGGGARSDLLLQLISNATGQVLHRGEGADVGPALGAARLAASGAGALNRDALAAEPEATAVFTPAEDAALLARRERFRAMYRALKTV